MTERTDETKAPSRREIEALREKLGDLIRLTPSWHWQCRKLDALGAGSVHLKLELFQYTGTFKPRGALANMMALDAEQLQRGVTSVSAGNHAIATSYAAQVLGSSVKVVMPQNANPARVATCREFGGDVVLVPDVHQAFAKTRQIEEEEGRAFIHPFDGRGVALGTATLGLEFAQQVPQLDLVIVPIGGGGLCAGVSTAIKQALPQCKVIGVEPEGADSMHRSFAAGSPQKIDAVRTIADSLGAPHAAQYSFDLCRQHVDELVMVSDDDLCRCMHLLFAEAKLAVEPAGAASTAALLGPLRDRVEGLNVGLIVCGSNIDHSTYAQYLARGAEA
ncbi:MAG: threonine ammonia-lyase [Planctomycetota bacterium]|jgi:threonine dehydratase